MYLYAKKSADLLGSKGSKDTKPLITYFTDAKYETELRYDTKVTGRISYAHISDLSRISAYKSCFCGFRLKESELTWLWSYIHRHWYLFASNTHSSFCSIH
ncbi:hypothetical protein Bca52824_039955 [Brassica carinata]|uniref:Uncharacterized protein n=1 Tax=Brassica carinata TaxID=52824 RepID=A0A8X7UYM3_BRACI|nr:hypothetical protein Bca52824_039955 [Brassica carinata]